MKTLKTTLAAAAVLLCTTLGAQENQPGNHTNWKERIESEKVAFITGKLDLSVEEAQVFWPVYNAVEKERDAAQKKVMTCFKNLKDSTKPQEGQKIDDKKVEKALEDYLDAIEDRQEIDDKAVDKFKKVLSMEKVGRLYLAEEQFRRNQITRLHGGNGGCQGGPKGCPEGHRQ